ncbi:hypothetical protein F5Y16DRAFT_371594, partial [Xylariaceae sp. FL0255]
MCYYQIIHASHHHALLSIDAIHRANHRCALMYPNYKADKCGSHSCCRVSCELVVSCDEAREVGFPGIIGTVGEER